MEYLQLNWGNWDEICDFTHKWFIKGVYLDKNKIIPSGHIIFNDSDIGLLLKLNGKKVLVKQDDYIIKENNTIKIMNQLQFDRKRKLEKINKI